MNPGEDSGSDGRATEPAVASGSARVGVLSALLLSDDPAELLAGHAADLDEAWRSTAAGLDANTHLSVDAARRLHLSAGAGRSARSPASASACRIQLRNAWRMHTQLLSQPAHDQLRIRLPVQPHGTLPQLVGVLLRCCHSSSSPWPSDHDQKTPGNRGNLSSAGVPLTLAA